MAPLKLEKFGGEIPAWDARLLPDGQAQVALNCYLPSGALIGWRQPKLLYTLKNAAAKYAFRIPGASNDKRIIAPDSFWMEFLDRDTNVIRTPVADDQYDRYYFASPSIPPSYNTHDRIIAGQPSWLLGVPGSGCAPGVVVTGGGETVQIGFNQVLPGGGFPSFVASNAVFLIPVIPNGSLLMQDVTWVPGDTIGGLNFQAVVYSDLNGQPYQLLGTGANVTGTTAGVPVASTFPNGVSVQANSVYWIGIALDSACSVMIANVNPGQGALFYNTYSNGPPAFASGSGLGQYNFEMWANFIGQSVFEARAYVYTWVTAYGEEGPPSPPTIVNGWSNGVWTISLFTPDPLDMGTQRNITKTRIYRSITSSSGQASYFFVAEIPVTQAIYEDTTDDATVANNAQMQSLYWSGPPSDLQGIEAFPNGVAIGFKSNEVWFSEAYRPHAWPPNYVLTTEFPIIGIGVTGSMIVVCTEETPYVVTGVNPASMSMLKLNLVEPCLHRGSIVSTDTTVLFVSQNGLIQISQSGAGANITEGWVSREKWQALTPQKFIRAIKLTTSYFAFGTVSGSDNSVAQRGFTVELSQEDQTSFTIWPQAGGHRLGFGELTSPNNMDIDNVLIDPWTGVGMLLQGNGIYYYDFTDQAPTIVPYKWRSKIYQNLTKKNYAAFRVWFDIPPGTPAQNPVRNVNDPQPTLAPNQFGIARIYADGQLYTTRELRTSGELLRIYSSSKFESWQFELEGRVTISNAQFAETVKQLGLI